MAIVSVTELAERTGTTDEQQNSYTRNFHVLSNSASETVPAVQVASAGGTTIPTIGEEYPDDSDALCRSVTPSLMQSKDDRLNWRVVCVYTTAVLGPGVLVNEISAQWRTRKEQEVVERDTTTDDAILNSAGQWFDPPPTRNASYATIVITRYETQAEWNESRNATYLDAVNSDWWRSYAPNTARIDDISGQRVRYQSTYRYAVTYVVMIRPGGWTRELLDQGLGYLDSDNELVVAKDGDDVPYNVPINLDGSGGILPVGSAPVYVEHDVYVQRPFSILNLTTE